MSRLGIAAMRALAQGVAKTAATVKALQANQPNLGTEMRALFRAGREDLANILLGGMAGTTREPGAPGNPTPQITTANLTGKKLDLDMGR